MSTTASDPTPSADRTQESRKDIPICVAVFTFAVAAIAVALRIYTRRNIINQLGIDDYCAIAALVCCPGPSTDTWPVMAAEPANLYCSSLSLAVTLLSLIVSPPLPLSSCQGICLDWRDATDMSSLTTSPDTNFGLGQHIWNVPTELIPLYLRVRLTRMQHSLQLG